MENESDRDLRLVKLPDIVCTHSGSNFTVINNSILRNPNLSLKAKGLLSLLLSNRDGWTTYMTTLRKMNEDGEGSIRNGIIELKKKGYVLSLVIRSKEGDGRVLKSVMAITDTPGEFDLENFINETEQKGCRVTLPPANKVKSLNYGNAKLNNPNLNPEYDKSLNYGNAKLNNPVLRRLSYNNTKYSNNSIEITSPNGDSIVFDDAHTSSATCPSGNGENNTVQNNLLHSPSRHGEAGGAPSGSRRRERQTPIPDSDISAERVQAARRVSHTERERSVARSRDQALRIGEELYLGMDFPGLLRKVGLSQETVAWGMEKDIANLGRLVMEKFQKKSTVEGVIRWLHSHHGDQFVPSITSAAELSSKFPKVQAAMARPAKQYSGGGNGKRSNSDFNYGFSKDFDLDELGNNNMTHEQRRS